MEVPSISPPDLTPAISFIVPTYRRPEVLEMCLGHLRDMRAIDGLAIEIRVYDNGSPSPSQSVIDEFRESLPLHYTINSPGHGLGYSLRRGADEATGDIIVELNDDALVPPEFLQHIKSIFDSDSTIGVLGVRAIEEGYINSDESIGVINQGSASIIGNFNRETDGLIDVEHVYGFCYAWRREIVLRGAGHDSVLLAQDYSSGNRIETDHCLAARRLGYRVVYDGSLPVLHLAKPRADLDERSLQWKLNHWRNTLYLYLKHFGPFGRRAIAIRFAIVDMGLISLIRQPNTTNWLYFWTGIKARTSAVWHWTKYLTGRRPKLASLTTTDSFDGTEPE